MKGRKLIIETTLKCNANCIYCYNSNNRDENNAKIESFQIPSNFLLKWNIKNLVITGGEPLIDFEKTIRLIKYYRDKIDYIELLTNGLLLNRNKLKLLMKSGLDGISISCDGIKEETQFALRKIHPEVIWKKIKLVKLTTSNLKLTLLYTLTKLNSSMKNLTEFIFKALETNIDAIKFQPVTSNMKPEIRELELSPGELIQIFDVIEKNKEKWKIKNSELFFNFARELYLTKSQNKYISCPIPVNNLFLNAKGILLKCPVLALNESSIFDSYSKVVFKKLDCNLKSHCLCMF